MPDTVTFDYAATGFIPYDPVIWDPYPDSWQTVSDFAYDSDLYLARARRAIVDGENREAEYIVAAEYTCSCRIDGRRCQIVVPSGMLTDLTSSPWAARLIIGRVGPHLEAAIVHDFLFIAWQDIAGRNAREADFHFANAVMDAALEAAGVGALKRRLIRSAVSSPVGWHTFTDPNPKPRYVRRIDDRSLWDTPIA